MKGGSQFSKRNGESTATTPQSFVSNIFRFESHAANDQRYVTLPLYLPISEPPQLSIHTDLVTAGDVSLKAMGGQGWSSLVLVVPSEIYQKLNLKNSRLA